MIQTIIVDDEHLARKGLRMVFPWDRHGFEIVGEASNYDKALILVQEKDIQLVITDITMPKMSGIDLMKQLQLTSPEIKVVVVTCHQDFEYIQEALRLGAIDYIIKTQLEEQDLNEVLSRIAKHFTSDVIKQEESVISPPSEAVLYDMQLEFKHSLQWIIDEKQYSLVKEQLKLNSLWENRLLEAITCWKGSIPTFPTWHVYMENIPKVYSQIYLDDIRKELQKWLRRSSYSEEIIYGIVCSLEIIQRANDKNDVSQSQLCMQVNISKGYFSKAFKEIMGISFSHYMQHINMESAKEWLIETNNTVYWVAERCGFSDTRYFSRVFREHTGLLPTEYRNQR